MTLDEIARAWTECTEEFVPRRERHMFLDLKRRVEALESLAWHSARLDASPPAPAVATEVLGPGLGRGGNLPDVSPAPSQARCEALASRERTPGDLVPCVLPAGHGGEHRSSYGDGWPSTAPSQAREIARASGSVLRIGLSSWPLSVGGIAAGTQYAREIAGAVSCALDAALAEARAERDEWRASAERLDAASKCVTCHGSILPPMQCGYCIEHEMPVPGMYARPATIALRERAERAEQALRAIVACCEHCDEGIGFAEPGIHADGDGEDARYDCTREATIALSALDAAKSGGAT